MEFFDSDHGHAAASSRNHSHLNTTMSDRLLLLSPRTPPLQCNASTAATPPPPIDLYDSDIERWGGGGNATDDDDDDFVEGGGGFLQGIGTDLSSYKRRLSLSLNAVAETVPSLPFTPPPPLPPSSC